MHIDTILIDNIAYTLDGATHTAKVKKNAEAEYCGDMVIPEHVSYQGETYRITTVGFEAFFALHAAYLYCDTKFCNRTI